MIALGHVFVPFKSEEMICWPCGFVIWRVESEVQAEAAVRAIRGKNPAVCCGGEWHRQCLEGARV